MEEDNLIWKTGIIFFLVLAAAVVTAAQTAIRSVNEGRIKSKAEEGDKRAKLILRCREEMDRYMTIYQVMVSAAAILIGALYSARLVYYSVSYTAGLEEILTPAAIRGILLLVFSVALLYLVILFSTILPKKLARRKPEGILYATIYPVWLLSCIFRPFAAMLDASASFLLFLLRIKQTGTEGSVTEEEIISMVNEGHEQGVLEDGEVLMISNIIAFNGKEVKDIMTHRKKTVIVTMERTLEEAINFMLKEGFSRCPLYDEEIDEIIGILHLKDMMNCYLSDRTKSISLKSVAREPFFVPDTQSIDVLFRKMQSRKIHMAVAVDEYGQTAGIVTNEDIIEEIVGSIFDEYDEEERLIIKQGEGKFLMLGLAPLDEVEKALEIEIEREDFDTLNGFMISLVGHIPEERERVSISYKGYRFRIIDLQHNMIGYVKVMKEKAAEG